MRSLWVFGLTAIFIATAFVPPTVANFLGFTERARATIERRTKASLTSGDIPGVADLKKAANLMKTLSKDPRTSVLVEDSKGKMYSDLLKKSASALESVLPEPKKNLKKAVNEILSNPAKTSGRWVSLLQDEKQPKLRKQYERIEWATEKNDLRLCREIESVDSASPAYGDLLAFCVARVTRSVTRCGQIGAGAKLLKSICKEELDDSETLTGLKLL
ncbi:hypothetical protein A3A67_03300 [Candidatus Peribacteria bacterium RIFCSPLOWO2_01_FULL_51_18]|nr:MAG: hypothetical protein A3C52_03345 [Candidatus Peribacteria bacterium RIFCSPHIGHO2_02_FULL_51_15]OGJ66460.1 MAG: hypothetical protein A3A67_03300 [Candidatus Peribacteria bacterium RIFCSPLOWO2_01_FULL_51_18]OGJ68209.1 MAG: hypothetical protein A3J34_00640 [Candidatus Peribacteria bacterium RIFCSPLOWO2_02_FULL_51_10]